MTASPETPARVVLVDKPEGWTSFQVVRRLKPLLGRRLGHAGTLDPFATGLLVLLAGQATRISEFVMEFPKEYLVTVQFGTVSSTQDPSGRLEMTGKTTDEAAVAQALESFRGDIVQQVPLTSAVKVEGEALYRRAHRGETYDTPIRRVQVHHLSMLEFDAAAQRARLRACTSKGTYIRTLAHDLGRALGVGAYALELRRLRSGALSVEDAVLPDDVAEAIEAGGSPAVLSVSDVLFSLPRYDVQGVEEKRARNGNNLAEAPAGLVRVYGADGLLGIYEGVTGKSRPRVVFSSPVE